MAGTRYWLVVREAGRNVRAAPWLTLVAVLTIGVSLVMVGLFGLVLANSGRIVDSLTKELTLTIYLDPEATAPEVEGLLQTVAARDEVEEVRYVNSREDGERNRALLGDALLDGLEDALPGQHALELRLRPSGLGKEHLSQLAELIRAVEIVETVEDIPFDASEVRLVVAILDLVRVTGSIVCGVLLAAAIFFTFSTIKLGVLAREGEIEVLRLVGATNGFIAAPFYLEGSGAGLCGSVLAIGLVDFIHGRLEAYAAEQHFLSLDLELMPAGMVAWLVLGGTLMGWAAAVLSLRRHLRT